MHDFGAALWIALAAIFIAELGDKSQLLAMAFAARFKPIPILVGIAVATAVVQAVSVFVGAVVGAALPMRTVSLIAGVAFLVFAAWTLRGEKLDERDEERVEKARASGRSAVFVASVTFGLSELGDKTMLVTITLAAQNGAVGTWLGATLGMVAADALAIGVGAWLGGRVPDRAIRFGAAALFAAFGIYLLTDVLLS